MASHGFEKAGWTGKWFVEIEDYPHEVYKRNFPDSKGYYDVKDCGAHNLEPVDVIFGGFPCQDISVAGKQGGIHSDRSGLFFQFARIVSELRPRWWLLENVPNLLTGNDGRWFSAILNEMASLGYDATWHCIPACAVGAPHRRDRVWIVAHAIRTAFSEKTDGRTECFRQRNKVGNVNRPSSQDVANTDRTRQPQPQGVEQNIGRRIINSSQDVSNSKSARHSTRVQPEPARPNGGPRQPQPRLGGGLSHGLTPWMDEPPGLPRLTQVKENRVNRLKALGNGLMWQIPYMIALGINEIDSKI